MDPLNNFPPLFETKLELNIPHINFVPSLDTQIDGNIVTLIETIMNDVMYMTTLIPRVYSEYNHPDYMVRQVQAKFFNSTVIPSIYIINNMYHFYLQQNVQEHVDIISVKDDIMHCVEVVIQLVNNNLLFF